MTRKLTHHDIFDAALDDTLFESLPDRLAAEMGVPSALFFMLHPDSYCEITAGTQPEANSTYEEVASEDPWMAHVSPDKIGRGAFRLSDFVSSQELEGSVMYNEFIIAHRLDRYWCLGMLQATRDGIAITAFHRSRSMGDFGEADLALVNGLAQDLGRMHGIRRELERNRIIEVAAVDRSLRDLAPIFELDHDGRVLRMNGQAEMLFRLHPRLFIDAGCSLGLRGPMAEQFRRAVGQAAAAERREAGTVDLPQLRALDGRILPAIRLNLLPRTDGGRRVLVIATVEGEVGLAELFATPTEEIRLTPREREVLHGLVRGRRRDQLAHDLDVSVPTVDLHSANLRRKLGARTVAEAVAIALRMGLI